jgi:hypothetical protein
VLYEYVRKGDEGLALFITDMIVETVPGLETITGKSMVSAPAIATKQIIKIKLNNSLPMIPRLLI